MTEKTDMKERIKAKLLAGELGPIVARLDYSKPPPGMWVDEAVWNGEGQEPDRGPFSFGESFEDGWSWFDDFETALAAAWAHLKRHNDPPGMLTFGPSGHGQRWMWTLLSGAAHPEVWHATQAGARDAAWTWHDRRLALAEQHDKADADGRFVSSDDESSWPSVLAWSDEQCDVSEAAGAAGRRAAEMPEVLRG